MRKLLLLLLLLSPIAWAQSPPVGPINITSTQCATIFVGDKGGTAAVAVTGTWTGTLQPQVVIQNQAAANVQVTPSTSSTAQATITANGYFYAAVAGNTQFQVCGATVASGTAVIYINLSTSGASASGAAAAGGAVSSVFTRTGAVTAQTGDYTVAQVTGAAPLASPTFTGVPAAPTAASGTNTTQLASTAFVAAAVQGVNPAVAVQIATTQASDTSGLTYANGVSGIGATLTGTVNTAITIDGVTLTAVGQRVLVKNDTQAPSGAFNGVYSLTVIQTAILAPVLTRALDFDMPSDMNNTGAIPVINGTANASTQWVISSTVNTVGTDPVTFTQFSSNPSNIVTQTSNASSGQVCTYTGTNKVCVPATALPNGVTATTQSANDNSTKVATTAYVDAKSTLALGKWLCGNHADGAGATWTCVSRVNVASGDHLLAGCSGLRTTAATTTIADTLTTTWTRVGSEYAETTPNTYNITAFRGTAASSGADTITCTSTDAGTSFTASFLLTTIGDSSVDVAPTGNTGTNGHSDSTQLTTTAANDLCFQWMTGATITVGGGGNTLVYNAGNGAGLAMRSVGPAGNYMLTTETGGNFGNFSFCLK